MDDDEPTMTRVPRPVPAERADSYRRSGLWGDPGLADALSEAASRLPRRTAVVDDQRSLTWAELDEAAEVGVESLRRAGIGAGHPAVVVSGNSIDGVIAVHAVLRGGVPALLLDRRVGSADVRAATKVLRGRPPVIAPAKHLDRLAPDDGDSIALESLCSEGSTTEAAEPPSRPDPDAPAIVLFTSGTTGRPKAVVHSINTLGAGARNMIEFSNCRESDVLFLVSPLTSIAGVMQLAVSARTGAPLVLVDGFDDDRTFDRLDEMSGTLLGGAPIIAERLLGTAIARERTRVPLRALMLGGAMLPRPLLELATDRFGIEIVRVYGSSEAPNFSSSRPTDDRSTRLGDDGALTPGAEARVGSRAHDGEGLLRGPSVFLGYLDPEDNEAAFEGEWFRAGDLIELSDDGRITVTGRIKEVVNRNGLKISLGEIDQALAGMPGLAEHGCFALPDEQTGEHLAVAVVSEPGHTIGLAEVTGHLQAAGVARHKHPEELVVWPEPLPRTASGKVIRASLVRDASGLPSELAARMR